MSNKNHSNYVYVLESELCIKIGISNDPYTRLYNINSQCREVSVPTFKLVYFRDCRFVGVARKLEKQLHSNYKEFRFNNLPAKIFGYTEMFDRSIKQSVVSDIESENIQNLKIFDYDPFLHLKGFNKYKESVFDEVFSNVITMSSFGITKSSINSYKKLDINNLCANIKYARENSYDLLHMTTFADRCTTTSFVNHSRRLLDNSSFDVNSDVFDVSMKLCGDDEYTRKVCSGIRSKLEKQDSKINKTKFLILPSLNLDEPYNKKTKVLSEFKGKYERLLTNNFIIV